MKLWKQTAWLLLCIPLLSALLTGCWDDRELNELGITSGSAYDWEDNEWKATFQVINPSSGASGMGGSGGGSTTSPPFITFTVKGRTIMEAIERTNLTSTREMFFPTRELLFWGNRWQSTASTNSLICFCASRTPGKQCMSSCLRMGPEIFWTS